MGAGMNDDAALFELPNDPSPKLRWLARYQLTTRKTAKGWVCEWDEDNRGTGKTEEDTCADFCLKTKLKHWSRE